MTSIDINQVLAYMEDPEFNNKGFRLVWVRASGKNQGKIKTIEHCRKGRPKNRRSATIRGPYKNKGLHIDHGTIPIVDLSCDQYMTVKISHIIHFNNAKVLH